MKEFFAVAMLALAITTTSAANHCGSKLAAEDLKGNCRATNATMGALQATAPVVTNMVIIPATWSVDAFNNGTVSAPGKTWDHCVGVNGAVVCRTIIEFPTLAIPKTARIVSVTLRVNVPYVSGPLLSSTWDIGLYGIVGNNAQTDPAATVFARAGVLNYIKAYTGLRTTGVKTIVLPSEGVVDLSAAVTAAVPFTLAIKQTPESGVNQFTTISRYRYLDTTNNTPQLMVVTQ